jgi:3-methylfumaryl-CoA hydratase
MMVTLEDLSIPEVTESWIGVDQARRIQVTLGDQATLRDGDDLPLLWHWMYFLPLTPTSELGVDGHPRVSHALESYKRRMWAEGRVEAVRRLHIGTHAVRHTELMEAREAHGRSGELLLITLRHTYLQGGRETLFEDQVLVYRSLEDVNRRTPSAENGRLCEVDWIFEQTVDERLLFRFSALTFNAHRIHYDRTYAREEEGYQDLVVHGPLTAVLVARHISRETDMRTFRFRAKAPIFVNQPFSVQGRRAAREVAVRVMRADGIEAFEANVEVAHGTSL